MIPSPTPKKLAPPMLSLRSSTVARRLIPWLAGIASCCGHHASAAGVHHDVFIIAGQSNADGRAPVADLVDNLAVYAPVQPGAFIYYSNPAYTSTDTSHYQKWVSLQPGYSTLGAAVPGPIFGAEVSAGVNLSGFDAASTVDFIKVCEGGTSIASQWKPRSGRDYVALIAGVQDALAKLTAAGDTYTVKAMYWHQGESDGSRTTTYASLLTTLVADIRADLNLPNMPFYIGELAYTHDQTFLDAQWSASRSIPNAGFVSAKGLMLNTDNIHFNAVGQVSMGLRWASVYKGTLDALSFESLWYGQGLLERQDNWAYATTQPTGLVTATATQGEYLGGQAAGHVGSSGEVFFGRLGSAPLLDAHTMSADFFPGDAGYDGDGVPNSSLQVFGWKSDSNGDRYFSVNEAAVGFGLNPTGAATGGGVFMVKTLAGTVLATGFPYKIDNWYNVRLTWTDVVAGNRTVSLYVRDLKAKADLNGGNPVLTTTVSDANFGGSPASWIGTAIHASKGLLDNIGVVPTRATSGPVATVYPVNSLDQIYGARASSGPALGYYGSAAGSKTFSPATTLPGLIGVSGGTATVQGNGNVVVGFLLPTLAAGQALVGAQVRVTVAGTNGTVPKVDLYGLGAANTAFDPSPGAQAAMTTDTSLFYQGTSDASQTLVARDIAANSPVYSGDATSFVRGLYAGQAPAGNRAEAFFRLNQEVATPIGTIARVTLSNTGMAPPTLTLSTVTVPAPTVALTAPASGLAASEGQNVGVHADVTPGQAPPAPAGAPTIRSVDLSLNGTLVRRDTAAPFDWSGPTDAALTNLAAGVYDLRVLTTDSYGSATETLGALNVALAPGVPYAVTPFGDLPVHVYARSSGSTAFTVQAPGQDLGGTSDGGGLIQQTFAGDVTLVTRVTGLTNTNPLAKAGLMLRNDASDSSSNVSLTITPTSANGLLFQSRAVGGDPTTTVASQTGVGLPVWLRLTRQGSTVTAAYSSTGAAWTTLGSANNSLNASVMSGLVASAHDPALVTKAVFTNFSEAAENSYAAWRAANFGPNDLVNDAVSGPDADADGDGISNLAEFYAGLDPHTVNSSAATQPTAISVNATTFGLAFRESKNLPAGARTFYFSADLVNWTPVTPSTVVMKQDLGAAASYEAQFPVTATREFFRIGYAYSQ